MPQLLAAAIVAAFPTTAAVVAGLTVATWIASGVFLLGSLAMSASQKRKAERAARAQFDAAQVDRLANIPATVAPRELVLGRVRKGGHVFFRGSSGPFNSTFSMCIALAAHEIDGIEQIYFNDVPIELSGEAVLTAPYGRYVKNSATDAIFGNITGLAHTPDAGEGQVVVTRSQSGQGSGEDYQGPVIEQVSFTLAGATLTISGYDGSWTYQVTYQYTELTTNAHVRKYLGAPGQAADSRLIGLYPGIWTADHRADGVAYLICEFEYNETSFPSGLPNVTALVRGAKCYDPRDGVTLFTENPALMMRHVMTHPQFGRRASVSVAEDTRINAAANACDTLLDYGVGPLPLFRAATVIPFGATARDALDDLSQAMGGQWAYASGEFFVRAGVYQAPVMALTDADLAVVQRSEGGSVSQNPISISTHRPRNEKINTVVARIWDQAAGYIQTPIMPFAVDSLIAADGAPLVQEVTMPAVFYGAQAHHIAGIMLRDGRDPLTVVLPFQLSAYPLQLFDTVTLTLSRYGWAGKEFQVMGRTMLQDGLIQLTLKETAAAIFQPGGGFQPGGFASNGTLPRPWDITAPTIVSLTSGEADLIIQADGTIINGVRVTWTKSRDAAVLQGGTIEVSYQVLPDTAWRTVVVPGGDETTLLTGIPDGSPVIVRVRARSPLAASDWSPHAVTTANGKTFPPPNIAGLSISGSVLTWSIERRPPDLAGYVFRFHYGNNLDWNSAVPLHNGVITESPYDLITRPGGVVTVMGKAIDTSGNVSLASANIVMNLGEPPIANVVEDWDFDALGWPRSAPDSSGWSIVSGKPTANALDSFYGTDNQSFYGEDTASFYGSSVFAQMVFVTEEIAITQALAGSVMTLVAEALGVDLRIEYRLAGPSPFYGPDNQSFYDQDGAAPFYGAPGAWFPWPGQMVADRAVYQFRVTIGAGAVQGVLQSMVLTVDAPDVIEALSDLAISSTGTVLPLTKPFAAIKTVQAQLQTNGSGAVTVEVDKSVPLAPVIRAFNAAHTAVSGATADITVQGY